MSTGFNAPKIMVVDDTPANLDLLGSFLGSKGFSVQLFPEPSLALSAIANEPPDLILLDINMPNMSGYEVCEQLKSRADTADIPVIFVSGLNETGDKLAAFARGGVDYITKPFHFDEVNARVGMHLKIRFMQKELQRHNESLADLVQEQVQRISDAQLATILAMSKIAEARDDDTGQHIERTQSYCRALAMRLKKLPEYKTIVTKQFVDNIYHASPLHDIGKVAIPDSILLKPGKLTDDEFETMKTHAAIGAKNLRAVRNSYPNNDFVIMGIAIAQSHHEKWNGKGYPDGLAGEDIPLCARIMAIADVYDALRSKRCYKDAFSHEKSRDIIIGDSGTHFDPTLVDLFKDAEEEFDEINRTLQE